MTMAVFEVTGLADPQFLLRVLGYFAQRSLVPARIRGDRDGDMLAISIDVPDLALREAEIVAERLRTAVLVDHVLLNCQPNIAADPY